MSPFFWGGDMLHKGHHAMLLPPEIYVVYSILGTLLGICTGSASLTGTRSARAALESLTDV